MSSSCIHITALLFRIEAANRSGLTNPACTSRECSWIVPQPTTKLQPTRICDMNWTASKLNKGKNDHCYRNHITYQHLLSIHCVG